MGMAGSRSLSHTEDIGALKARVLDELRLLTESTKALDKERRGIDKAGRDPKTPLLHRMLARVEEMLDDPELKPSDRLRAAGIIEHVYAEIRKERAELIKEAHKRAVEAQQDINRTSVAHRKLDIEERIAEMQGATSADPDDLSPDQLERLVNGR